MTVFFLSLSYLLVSLAPGARAQQATGESVLLEGDSIDVYIDMEDFEILKSKQQGDMFEIKILSNVDRYGNTLIGKSTPVYGTVTGRSKGGIYGGAGKLTARIDSTHSTAGTLIPLRGELTLEGSGKKTLAYILFPFGWLIKGNDIRFPEGANTFKPVVSGDTPLEYLR
jgi:hypothetical protein